jgi:haloalkane dehalogenase
MVRVGDHAIHLVDHGEGPAVLLMHGNPTWCFLWRKVIRRLEGVRAIAPDLVGFGLSDKPRRTSFHDLEGHVARMVAVVEHLAVDELVIVGQDWGGPIACGVGEALKDRVRGLVLANTAVLTPRRPPRATTFHRFAHLPGISDLVFRGLGFPQATSLHSVQGDPGSIGPYERRAYRWPLRRLRDRAGPVALARMVPHREGHPSLPALDRIGRWVEGWEGPAALVWGLRDPILGRALRRHREALPQASVRESQAGHFLQEEVPDLLAEAIHEVVQAASLRRATG